jgi:hypothetical protein
MLRIELLMTLLAGFAGGLIGALWSGIVTAPLLSRWPQMKPAPVQPESAVRLLAGAALYGGCGAAAGFLFWLGWGLAALVATPWYLVGVLYGVLIWTAGTLPVLGAASLRLRQPAGAVGVLAIEYLVTTIAAGVLCAYVWHRSG